MKSLQKCKQNKTKRNKIISDIQRNQDDLVYLARYQGSTLSCIFLYKQLYFR